MPIADPRPAGPPSAPPQALAVGGQFPTALRFAIRNQARNRLAAILLVAFVPAWYLLLLTFAGHKHLSFRLFATGQWFPSFGPMQFAVGGSLGHTALPGHLALGLAWAAVLTAAGLVIFYARTRVRTHPAGRVPAPGP
jgi:hypothetical protein